ncbi:hypothetical protein HYW42_04295 [Candidatus Daviesbacteria bacterium]|nr:hypothetical protein [Candidatus Daviesbacteria bacterium]
MPLCEQEVGVEQLTSQLFQSARKAGLMLFSDPGSIGALQGRNAFSCSALTQILIAAHLTSLALAIVAKRERPAASLDLILYDERRRRSPLIDKFNRQPVYSLLRQILHVDPAHRVINDLPSLTIRAFPTGLTTVEWVETSRSPVDRTADSNPALITPDGRVISNINLFVLNSQRETSPDH